MAISTLVDLPVVGPLDHDRPARRCRTRTRPSRRRARRPWRARHRRRSRPRPGQAVGDDHEAPPWSVSGVLRRWWTAANARPAAATSCRATPCVSNRTGPSPARVHVHAARHEVVQLDGLSPVEPARRGGLDQVAALDIDPDDVVGAPRRRTARRRRARSRSGPPSWLRRRRSARGRRPPSAGNNGAVRRRHGHDHVGARRPPRPRSPRQRRDAAARARGRGRPPLRAASRACAPAVSVGQLVGKHLAGGTTPDGRRRQCRHARRRRPRDGGSRGRRPPACGGGSGHRRRACTAAGRRGRTAR